MSMTTTPHDPRSMHELINALESERDDLRQQLAAEKLKTYDVKAKDARIAELEAQISNAK